MFHHIDARRGFRRRTTTLALGWAMLTAAAAPGQTTYFIPPDPLPPTLMPGDRILLGDGGTLPDSLSVPPGVTLDIVGGSTGLNLNVTSGGKLRLFDGQVGSNANLFGTARIAGGTLGQSFDAESGGEVVITGGTVELGFQARGGSQTVIAGGTIGFGFQADGQSTVHLFGTDFTLNGVPIAGLGSSGDTVVVAQRGGALLAGTLADGSAVDLVLATSGFERFDADATLLLTLHQPGDFNGDDVVDLEDFQQFKNQFGSDGVPRGTGADHNFSGTIDLADYTVWRDHLGSRLAAVRRTSAGWSATPVPEPGSAVLAALALVAAAGYSRIMSRTVCPPGIIGSTCSW